jgi:2-methylaconitate cis-trans-isomerase PrpF
MQFETTTQVRILRAARQLVEGVVRERTTFLVGCSKI